MFCLIVRTTFVYFILTIIDIYYMLHEHAS